MRSVCTIPVRQAAITMLALGGLLAWAAPVSAQGFGLGARLAWVTPDVDADVDVDVDALRFVGGQMRLLSAALWSRGLPGPAFGVVRAPQPEGHGDSDPGVTPPAPGQRQRFSIPAGRARLVSPQGRGARRPRGSSVTTTEFGWHAGVGLEILPSRHFGIHGDYRYTFLDFGDDDDDDDEGFIGGLLPGHRGSMWTVGATVYF